MDKVPLGTHKDWQKELKSKLTPEIVQKIMDKVIDLNSKEDEYAFSGLRNPKGKEYTELVGSVLRHGLLASFPRDSKSAEIFTAKEWAQKIKKADTVPHVYFHIRNSQWYGGGERTDRLKDYLGGFPKFIFDLEDYKESMVFAGHQMLHSEKKLAKENLRSYTPAGWPVADHGFRTPFNIPAKHFKGIILQKDTPRKTVTETARLMAEVYRNSPDRMMPIYDEEGNILWPKKMTKEEVKLKKGVK